MSGSRMTAEIGNLVTLLTPAEAAKHLAISTCQLRDLTQSGSIRYVKIGQWDWETRRYHPSDLPPQRARPRRTAEKLRLVTRLR